MERSRSRAPLFWAVILVVVALDGLTKYIAVRELIPERIPNEVFGDVLRFTLVYNPGAAFGLNVGEHSRLVFILLTLGALVILGRLYVQTRPGDVPRLVALGLVCAGAVGNLIDRLRSSRGVVDFIDVGVGAWRWPTFNVADIAVSTGAFLLAWVLWGEDRAAAAAAARAEPAPIRGDG